MHTYKADNDIMGTYVVIKTGRFGIKCTNMLVLSKYEMQFWDGLVMRRSVFIKNV